MLYFQVLLAAKVTIKPDHHARPTITAIFTTPVFDPIAISVLLNSTKALHIKLDTTAGRQVNPKDAQKIIILNFFRVDKTRRMLIEFLDLV